MYKTVVLLLTVLLLLFSGCEARTNSNPPSESSISEVPVESEAGSQESGSSDGDKNSEEESSEQSESPYIYHEYTKKYYDYFMENNYVIMLLGDETGDRGFSDSEMSAYVLCELIKLNNDSYDQEVGFPKEDFDALTEKYFGTAVKNYENRMSSVIPETGYITVTGWGGGLVVFVLKELETGSDGISTGVFYTFNFGMEGMTPSAGEDLLMGRFEAYGQPSLVTIVFEEKKDEKGGAYLRYYDMKSQGRAEPPYMTYQGK